MLTGLTATALTMAVPTVAGGVIVEKRSVRIMKTTTAMTSIRLRR